MELDGVCVIGMDPPSGRNCGWSVVKMESGKPVLLEKFTQILDDGPAGLAQVYSELDRMIVLHNPKALCLERSVGGGLIFVRGRLNEAVGVAKLCCYRHSIFTVEISPAHLKMVIAGHGRADKKAVMGNIVAAFGLESAGVEHECDAAAFGLTYFIDNGWTGYTVKVAFVDKKKNLKAAIQKALVTAKAAIKGGTPPDQLLNTLVSLGHPKPAARKAISKLKV